MKWQFLNRPAIGLAAVAAAAAMATAPAHAAPAQVTLDVSGIFSNDELGAAINELRSIGFAVGARITGIAWDVDLFADSPSWLSEISVDLSSDGGVGLSLSPGIGDNFSGTGSYFGAADLVALGLDFAIGASGQLKFEFFETFVDFPGDWDGLWERGTLTVTYVPEPASFGLAALALLGAGAASRRRKAD